MGKLKDLSDFFEKTGTYIPLSKIQQTKANKVLANNNRE